MWFRNLQIYRLDKPFELHAAALGQALATQPFTPCGGQQETRAGWVAPLGRHGSELVHATNGYLMICLKRQDRLLPAGVVNEELDQRAAEIEAREGRDMPRKERRALRDEVYMDLLPRAFTRSRLLYAYVAPRDRLLIVDAAASARAEELVQNLREALGSLSAVPLQTRHSPIDIMTRWLDSGRPAGDFELGQECELRANDDAAGVIRCRNQDLGAAEIVGHVKTGMHASKLALAWRQRVECVLDEKLVVRRLRFADMVQEQADDIPADDAATRFDSDFALMSLELSGFIGALCDAFGGMEIEQ